MHANAAQNSKSCEICEWWMTDSSGCLHGTIPQTWVITHLAPWSGGSGAPSLWGWHICPAWRWSCRCRWGWLRSARPAPRCIYSPAPDASSHTCWETSYRDWSQIKPCNIFLRFSVLLLILDTLPGYFQEGQNAKVTRIGKLNLSCFDKKLQVTDGTCLWCDNIISFL